MVYIFYTLLDGHCIPKLDNATNKIIFCLWLNLATVLRNLLLSFSGDWLDISSGVAVGAKGVINKTSFLCPTKAHVAYSLVPTLLEMEHLGGGIGDMGGRSGGGESNGVIRRDICIFILL